MPELPRRAPSPGAALRCCRRRAAPPQPKALLVRAAPRGLGELSHPQSSPRQEVLDTHTIAGRCALAARPEPRQPGRGRGRPHTYPLSASCPPPCPRLLARLERLSLALTPSVCPAAAAPAWDAHSTATPRAIPSSRPRHIASPEPSGCERPLPPLRRRRPPVPAALSPTSLSNASCEGEKRRKRSQ